MNQLLYFALVVPLHVLGQVCAYAGLFAGLLYLQWAHGGGVWR